MDRIVLDPNRAYVCTRTRYTRYTRCTGHKVTNRTMSNGMDQRTIGCLYLELKMNGTGTPAFLRLDNRATINANHYVVLPIPPIVITVNGWAAKNKLQTSIDPIFTFHNRDITNDIDDAVIGNITRVPSSTAAPIGDHGPIQDPFSPSISTAPIGFESPPTHINFGDSG